MYINYISKTFFDGQAVLAVLIFIRDFVHALLDHEYPQAADGAVFRRERDIGIFVLERVILYPFVFEGDGNGRTFAGFDRFFS